MYTRQHNKHTYRDLDPYYYDTAHYIPRQCVVNDDCNKTHLIDIKFILGRRSTIATNNICTEASDCFGILIPTEQNINEKYFVMAGCSLLSPCIHRRGMIQYKETLSIEEHTCLDINMTDAMALYIDTNPNVTIEQVFKESGHFFNIETGQMIKTSTCPSDTRSFYPHMYHDTVCIESATCNKNQYLNLSRGICKPITALNVYKYYITVDATSTSDRILRLRSNCSFFNYSYTNLDYPVNHMYKDNTCGKLILGDNSVITQSDISSSGNPFIVKTKETCGPGEYFNPESYQDILPGQKPNQVPFCSKCPIGTYQTKHDHLIPECSLHMKNICPKAFKLSTHISHMSTTQPSSDYCIQQTGNPLIQCPTYPKLMYFKQLDESGATGMCVDCRECEHYITECDPANQRDAVCGVPYDIDIIYPICITMYILYVLVAIGYYLIRSREKLHKIHNSV